MGKTGEVHALKRFARGCWLPFLGVAVLSLALFGFVFWQQSAIGRRFGPIVDDCAGCLFLGSTILWCILGVTALLARLLMPDEGPSNRAQTVYVVVFCALAAGELPGPC